MSEIQDEAYTELAQENEHLKFLLIEEQATIDELAKLCLRAADALDRTETRAWRYQWVESLIGELRNAAK